MLRKHMYPPPHWTHTHTLVTDLFRNNTKYLDLLRNKGKEVYMKDGYNQVYKLTTLVKVWKGPSTGAACQLGGGRPWWSACVRCI